MVDFVLDWHERENGVRVVRKVVAPTEADVLTLLDRLSLVGISALCVDYRGTGQDAEASLCISGEPGAYICYVVYDDDRIFEMHSDRAADQIVQREVGGQGESYPANLLVDRDACAKAIRHFLQTGQHHPEMVDRYPNRDGKKVQ